MGTHRQKVRKDIRYNNKSSIGQGISKGHEKADEKGILDTRLHRYDKIMKQISFTIHGNHEDRKGNPIPYFRTTQNGQWKPGARRYQGWKDYVRANYLDTVNSSLFIKREDFGDFHDFIQKKPIDLKGKKAYMTLAITFKDKTHADSDNIFKGIADALFINDKYLASRGFDYEYGEEGKVDVLIEIL